MAVVVQTVTIYRWTQSKSVGFVWVISIRLVLVVKTEKCSWSDLKCNRQDSTARWGCIERVSAATCRLFACCWSTVQTLMPSMISTSLRCTTPASAPTWSYCSVCLNTVQTCTLKIVQAKECFTTPLTEAACMFTSYQLSQYPSKLILLLLLLRCVSVVSDIAIFVLTRDTKLQPTNQFCCSKVLLPTCLADSN